MRNTSLIIEEINLDNFVFEGPLDYLDSLLLELGIEREKLLKNGIESFNINETTKNILAKAIPITLCKTLEFNLMDKLPEVLDIDTERFKNLL
jgi:hypothetical protein